MRQISMLLYILLTFLNNAVYSQVSSATDSLFIDEKIFTKVEIEASCPGGEMAWRKLNFSCSITI